jgi:hypothetical protein
MAFGVLPTGFNRKLLSDILKDVQDRHRATFGDGIEVAIASELGQLDGNFASGLAECWEILETAYHGFDPEAAQDYLLVALASLTGTTKRGATASTAQMSLNLNAGITVPAGSLVSLGGRPDIQFRLNKDAHNAGGSAADITVATDGTPLLSTCTQTGPIAASAGGLTTIVTSVAGWNTSTNTADATLGHNEDTPIQFRQRREDELALRGGSTVAAIRADLLDFEHHPELSSIRSVEVLENTSDFVDANGLPAHSFEVVLDDGDTPTVAANDVAQTIFETKPGGIKSTGAVSGTATDENGDTELEYFTRVTLKPVYFAIVLVTDPDTFPGDGNDQVKAALVQLGSEILGLHDPVIQLRFRAECLTISGVIDVTTFNQDFTPAPVVSANLSVGVRERATVSAANISI